MTTTPDIDRGMKLASWLADLDTLSVNPETHTELTTATATAALAQLLRDLLDTGEHDRLRDTVDLIDLLQDRAAEERSAMAERWKRFDSRREAERQRTEREAEEALTADCPYCGRPAGTRCVSVSGANPGTPHDVPHRDRLRNAHHLLAVRSS